MEVPNQLLQRIITHLQQERLQADTAGLLLSDLQTVAMTEAEKERKTSNGLEKTKTKVKPSAAPSTPLKNE